MNHRLPARFLSSLAVVAALLAPRAAGAQSAATGAASVAADASGYCDLVHGVATSEAALDASPSLFGTAGVVSGADASPGGSRLEPTGRIIVGANYSLTGIYRGILRLNGAGAECDRYRTVSQLLAFVVSTRDGETKHALRARLQVLDESLPHGEDILRATKAALERSRATLEEAQATQLRLDALRELAGQTRRDLESMAKLPDAPPGSIHEILRARDKAEAEAFDYESRLRESRAWDLSVRGGYDRIFAVPSYPPFFGIATLTVSTGAVFMPSAEARAARGHASWVRHQIYGVDDRVEQSVERLRAVLRADQKRLADNDVLLADLEARYRALASASGEKAATYAEYMWFDLARVRAEHAYLVAHVGDLKSLLGGVDGEAAR